MTATYESAISNYFMKDEKSLPEIVNLNLSKSSSLRYGENPHQDAAFYLSEGQTETWHQHQGKTLSYNNYADMESAFNIPQEFSNTACAIIKHANPCGFGLGGNSKEAYLRAVTTDPVSYFGGIVGFNCEVNVETAEELIQPFLECIIAPSYSDEALEILKKKKNLRVISVGKKGLTDEFSIKSVAGGYLYQQKDSQQGELEKLEIVTEKIPSELEINAMQLGWKLVRNVKSNAIVFANSNQLLGVGAGQMSRIDSVKIAIQKVAEAGLNLQGATMASDAFFPFSDSIEIAARAGISTVVQPGGSIKDAEVIKKANELGVAMVFTKIRHFLH
jgi:phosphoribosylaminoimidazolecarboxamide formyltransferase/IMP cyclohydrolase